MRPFCTTTLILPVKCTLSRSFCKAEDSTSEVRTLRRSKSGLPYCRSCEEMLQNFLIRPGQPHSTGHRQGRRALRRAAPVASAVSAHAAQELRYAF